MKGAPIDVGIGVLTAAAASAQGPTAIALHVTMNNPGLSDPASHLTAVRLVFGTEIAIQDLFLDPDLKVHSRD